MENTLKIKVDFDGDTTKSILNFINETKDGKYTNGNPIVPTVSYQRIEIYNGVSYPVSENNNATLLFGTTY